MSIIKNLFYYTMVCIVIKGTRHVKYDDNDNAETDYDDSVYWNDATVDCGVRYMRHTYSHQQQSDISNTTHAHKMRGNEHQNTSYNGNQFNQLLRIFNGKNVESGKIPWMVYLIHVPKGITCGGVIISRRHFKTAAHCLENDRNWLNYFILVGSLHINSGKQYRVTRCVIHKGYNKNVPIKGDIALCRLHINMQFNENVSPICLPRFWMTGTRLVGKSATVSGYGNTHGSDHTGNLKETEIKVIPNRQCYESYVKLPLIKRFGPRKFSNGIICAGVWEGGRDACDGDSGGPLAYYCNGRWYLIGIVAYGLECGWPRYPGLYTCIANYRLWLWIKIHFD